MFDLPIDTSSFRRLFFSVLDYRLFALSFSTFQFVITHKCSGHRAYSTVESLASGRSAQSLTVIMILPNHRIMRFFVSSQPLPNVTGPLLISLSSYSPIAQPATAAKQAASSVTNVSLSKIDDEISFNNFHDYLDNSYSALYLAILIITCIEILIGNSLLIYTVFTNKLFGNKLTTKHVISSLAISDLLIGLLIMPYYILVIRFYKLTNKKSWHYELWSNLDASLTTASIYSLCLVTLDRYLAVTRPISYTRKISNKKVKLSIVIVWIGSILTTFLSSILMWILNFIIKDADQRAISQKQIEQNAIFHITIAVLTFYLPFISIIFFNVKTYLTIKNRLTDKKLKIKRIENIRSSDQSRSSQRQLIHQFAGDQSTSHSNNTTITSQPEQQPNSSNDSSSSSSKLCLNCFTNQSYPNVSAISGTHVDFNNNAGNGGAGNFLRNSFKKKFNNRRCSLCSCHINRVKKESISQPNTSYHFSLTKQNTWKSFHKIFIEKLHQKHKEGLTRNYSFVFKEYKLIKLLLTINLCFAACWLPIYIYQELVRFNLVRIDNHLLNYLLYLGWLNSGLDPIIYLHLSKKWSSKFRKELKQRLFCLK